MARAYLGVGTNLGDRVANIERAYALLDRSDCAVLATSSLYETEPWGVIDQPCFLNAACLIETLLEPLELLRTLKGIEKEMGREPTIRFGPRPIDLDILLYDNLVMCTPELSIPHKGMLERSTVLVPLNDIAPTVIHPLTGRSIAAHLQELGAIGGLAPYPPGLSPQAH